jgi:hypothetical protein
MAKYTDNNNITFNNVSQIGSGVNFPPVGSSNGGSGYVINKGKVESKGSPIVNAIDIDWNGAEVETNKELNTSGDLIKWIKTSNDAKVDKVEGKGLSTNDYTTAEQTKLAEIESGAQVNVKPDWNAVAGADAEILNKPTIPAA